MTLTDSLCFHCVAGILITDLLHYTIQRRRLADQSKISGRAEWEVKKVLLHRRYTRPNATSSSLTLVVRVNTRGAEIND